MADITFSDIYTSFTKARVDKLAKDNSKEQSEEEVIEEQIENARIELKSIASADVVNADYNEDNEIVRRALILYTMRLLYSLNQREETGENEMNEAYRLLVRVWGLGVLKVIDLGSMDMDTDEKSLPSGVTELVDWETYDNVEYQ